MVVAALVVAPWQALVDVALVVVALVALVALAPWQALEPVQALVVAALVVAALVGPADVMQTCSWNSFFWLGVILICSQKKMRKSGA